MAEVAENNSGPGAEEHDGTESGGVSRSARAPVPRGPAAGRRKKLVLHIDLNNTVLVSDAVTGQGTVAALDYFLTTVTWGRISEHGKRRVSRERT